MVFLGYSQSELDQQYDQRVWAPNAATTIRSYREKSDAARAALGEPRTFAYGPSDAETLDVFPTSVPNAPIHVFVHGGAWRTLSKLDSAFAAEPFVRAGAHYVALDFAVLPHVKITDMVAQVRKAVAWIYSNAAQFGGDASRIHVSGHSSGGHLSGCLAVTDWPSMGLPADTVKSYVCLSGMYDLLPVRLSARNDYVKLDERIEHDLSPLRHLDKIAAPVLIGYGGKESAEFKRQSRTFAAALGQRLAEVIECEPLDHFEVALCLGDRDHPIGRAAFSFMGL